MTAREVIDAVVEALTQENVHQLAQAIKARRDLLETQPDPYGSREDLLGALAEEAALVPQAYFATDSEPWHEWARPP